LATNFDLQSHHQAILNRISAGTLSASAHIWDPRILIRFNMAWRWLLSRN